MDHLGGKVPVVVRDDYIIALEFYDGMNWFHTDIKKWSAEVKTRFIEDLNTLQYLVGMPLVALVEEDNTKLSKFGKVTGWEVINKVKLTNGKVGLVYTRSK